MHLSLSSMAPHKLTDYERRRLANIRRNDQMMAALKLHSKASQLSNFKPQRIVKSKNKLKPQTPIVIRRSSRTPKLSTFFQYKPKPQPQPQPQPQIESLGPISMADARDGTHSDTSFVKSLVHMEAQASPSIPEKLRSTKGNRFLNNATVQKRKIEISLRLESLELDPENIARVVYERVTSVRFFPSSNVKMIVAGNRFGDVGFWNVGESDVHLYHPHRAPISGILIQPHCLSKIYTSSADGIVRLMDAEKEIFDLVFDSDESIYALSQPTNETNCLYLAEGFGGLTVWDNRIRKCSSHWTLHRNRINTIDFNCENPHIVATSSSDRTACTWDLRYTNGDKLIPLRIFTHDKAVQSAYFSPSGCSLATTSMDTTICVYSGVNLEDAAVIYHNNQNTWSSIFRAKWGWDDSYLFIGNTKRGFDVVSTVEGKTVMTLESPHMSAISCKLDTHCYEVGTLVGATNGGVVYIWTSR